VYWLKIEKKRTSQSFHQNVTCCLHDLGDNCSHGIQQQPDTHYLDVHKSDRQYGFRTR